MLIRIVADHFVAGVDFMRGWSVAHIERYCRGKGWQVERMP